jgi:Cu(I)/Ag(I) efflux system membrane fusion protein
MAAKNLTLLIAGAFTTGLGGGAVLVWALQPHLSALSTVYEMRAEASPAKAPRKILYYRNPMDPTITSDRPMKDSMGMDYVPVYADDAPSNDAPPEAEEAGVVRIAPELVQNLGVRTAAVKRQRLALDINTVGTVAVDEHAVTALNPRVSGWVDQLHIKAVGEEVAPGQVLAEIYSPELELAQEEFLIALKGARGSSDGRALLDAARQRLRRFRVDESEIAALRRSRHAPRTLPLRSPYRGVVTELNARQGGYVTPETRMYALADLFRVWVNVEVYASQLPWVKQGDSATLTLPFMPGRSWSGRIEYLYPTLNTQSRTVQARLAFDNPDGTLKPGMYANATIHAAARDNVLAVPRESLILTGTETAVILAPGQGRFRPVPVEPGVEDAGHVEILKGVQEGQQVVLSGQFLLDAEASFRGAAARMEGAVEAAPVVNAPPAAPSEPEHTGDAHEAHGGHEGHGAPALGDRNPPSPPFSKGRSSQPHPVSIEPTDLIPPLKKGGPRGDFEATHENSSHTGHGHIDHSQPTPADHGGH